MKLLLRLSREAVRYKHLYVIAILSTFCLTLVNLAAPKALSAMTGIVERGMNEESLDAIGHLTLALVVLYLLRILFRFLSNYLAHKAAWFLVGDLRTKTYDKLERMHLGYFHDKQTGDLMSRVINDTRDFELLLRPYPPRYDHQRCNLRRGFGGASDHQLEARIDYLRPHPSDHGFRSHLRQKGTSLLPGIPEENG